MGLFSEEEGIEQQKVALHDWVKRYNGLLTESMRRAYNETAEHIKNMGDWLDPPGALFPHMNLVEEDLNSSSICKKAITYFPENEVGVLTKVYAEVETREDSGKKYRIDHAYFSDGQVNVDPTLGQFITLDDAISHFPDLFEGRVFVGTAREAEKLFGVKYLSK